MGLLEQAKRVATEGLCAAYGESLERLTEFDPTVYVVRRITLRLALRFQDTSSDEQLAGSWGQGLARTVLKQVHDGQTECVRFGNQAEFMACFLMDLLAGQAWQKWYYGPFRAYQRDQVSTTIQTLLSEQRAHLNALLTYLHQEHRLEETLLALDEISVGLLWKPDGYTNQQMLEVFEPIFQTAWQLLARVLEISIQPTNFQEPIRAFLTCNPAIPDWSDASSLADAVTDAVVFLKQRELSGQAIDPDTIVRLEQAVALLDWLDQVRLKAALLTVFNPSPGIDQTAPVRYGATQKQQAQRIDLESTLRRIEPSLDRNDPTGTGNAVRLLAAVLAEHPKWEEDASLRPGIMSVLAAWAETKRQALVATENHTGSSTELVVTQSSMHTAGAGVALLIRSLLDARLSGVVQSLHEANPNARQAFRPETVMLSLALRWAGIDPSNGLEAPQQIDPGLLHLTGHSARITLNGLHNIWAETDATVLQRLQDVLLKTLAGQRLLERTTLHLYRIELAENIQAVIGGDDSGLLWPYGAVFNNPQDLAITVAGWIAGWTEATGETPNELVIDPALASLAEQYSNVTVVQPEHDHTAHETGRERLHVMLEILEAGRFGLPNTDLTIALTANSLLRLWARWLKGFADSSTPYLLEQFIRRPGRVQVGPQHVLVELEAKPLDLALEMSGYLEPIDRVPWLEPSRLVFQRTDRM
jgi:hypothetical protein